MVGLLIEFTTIITLLIIEQTINKGIDNTLYRSLSLTKCKLIYFIELYSVILWCSQIIFLILLL